MTQQTPTQELAAEDLHRYVWRFKHIFRGMIFIKFDVLMLLLFSLRVLCSVFIDDCKPPNGDGKSSFLLINC